MSNFCARIEPIKGLRVTTSSSGSGAGGDKGKGRAEGGEKGRSSNPTDLSHDDTKPGIWPRGGGEKEEEEEEEEEEEGEGEGEGGRGGSEEHAAAAVRIVQLDHGHHQSLK